MNDTQTHNTMKIHKYGGTLFFLLLFGILGLQRFCAHQQMNTLHAMKPENVVVFKVSEVEFSPTDSIVRDFLHAVSDSESYFPNHDTSDEGWSLEIADEERTIQIRCYIPTRKPDTVVGHLGRFSKNGTIDYGYFQSRQLLLWYQNYKERWQSPKS